MLSADACTVHCVMNKALACSKRERRSCRVHLALAANRRPDHQRQCEDKHPHKSDDQERKALPDKSLQVLALSCM
jgi:hypothetical protein